MQKKNKKVLCMLIWKGHSVLHLRDRGKPIIKNWASSLLIKMKRIYVCVYRHTYLGVHMSCSFVSSRAEGMASGKARDLSLFILLHVLKFKLCESITYSKKKKTEGPFYFSISIVGDAVPLTHTQSSSWKYIVFL